MDAIQGTPAELIAGEVSASQVKRPLSVFDMFRVGIGPSSSHTVGPMRAGRNFAKCLQERLINPARIVVDLYGSLAATGKGHSTDLAVILGLAGYRPETVPGEVVAKLPGQVAKSKVLPLAHCGNIPFDMSLDMRFAPRITLPYHVNGLTLRALGPGGGTAGETEVFEDAPVLFQRTYYSVGGGFVMSQVGGSLEQPEVEPVVSSDAEDCHSQDAPYPFSTGAELLEICRTTRMSIAQVVRANEEAARDRQVVDAYLDHLRQVMEECVQAGCNTEGILPGGLLVQRRAARLARQLAEREGSEPGEIIWAGTPQDPLRAMEWVNLYALAVNEENAAGHRVVTAPTNGAAGVVPAVLGYLTNFCPEGRGARARENIHDFFLAATAIGALIKTNASIAGAEVGCQGEVGSASSMAAAGLAQAFGGSAEQVENAAEIAMEHNLGLTCDPVGGLVQVPCIERNAIAAVKAINAARMAMWGDGRHTVSLDVVIETMRQTGVDMLAKYKETSVGGLAVNVVEC